MKKARLLTNQLLSVACLLALVGTCHANTVVLNTVHDGWCNTGSVTIPLPATCNNNFGYTFNNTAAGGPDFYSITYHNYFVFDLTGVSGTITGAALTIFDDPQNIVSSLSATYDIYASTGFTFAGLTAGSLLGSVSAFNVGGQNVVINLNSTGIAMLNGAEGGLFAFGGALNSSNGSDFIFGYNTGQNQEVNCAAPFPLPGWDNCTTTNVTHELTLTTSSGVVPEPSSMILFGTGLAGVAGVIRRKLKR
jgi:PEP-CTERM motif